MPTICWSTALSEMAQAVERQEGPTHERGVRLAEGRELLLDGRGLPCGRHTGRQLDTTADAKERLQVGEYPGPAGAGGRSPPWRRQRDVVSGSRPRARLPLLAGPNACRSPGRGRDQLEQFLTRFSFGRPGANLTKLHGDGPNPAGRLPAWAIPPRNTCSHLLYAGLPKAHGATRRLVPCAFFVAEPA